MADTIRRAARALILDASQRVLLFRGQASDHGTCWFAPGGALDPGETYQAALVREIMEETGIQLDVGKRLPPVWTRDAPFTWEGKLERHLEQFFVVRVGDDTGHRVLREHRWWALAEIVQSGEHFAPARLAEHLARLLEGPLPASPVDVGA
jgi:8-oxo-dGTP pyrophosphatase MutT (NUDIX family)